MEPGSAQWAERHKLEHGHLHLNEEELCCVGD